MLSGLLEGIDVDENPGCCIGLLGRERGSEFFFHGQCGVGLQPVAADTVWEAASLSKPVVALLAIELGDRSTLLETLYRSVCERVMQVEVW